MTAISGKSCSTVINLFDTLFRYFDCTGLKRCWGFPLVLPTRCLQSQEWAARTLVNRSRNKFTYLGTSLSNSSSLPGKHTISIKIHAPTLKWLYIWVAWNSSYTALNKSGHSFLSLTSREQIQSVVFFNQFHLPLQLRSQEVYYQLWSSSVFGFWSHILKSTATIFCWILKIVI